MEDPNPQEKCLLCSKPNAKLCRQCKSVRYCSKKCQTADWATHKLLCSEFTSFENSPRPSEDHTRAILFPVDGENPVFVWLHCPVQCPHVDYRAPDVKPFVGSNEYLHQCPIPMNESLKMILSDAIYFCRREDLRFDAPLNKSIANITATRYGEYFPWRGPIIAYGMKGLTPDPTEHKDLDMGDFRHITDFIFNYRDNPNPRPPKRQSAGKTIKGVRINCEGDRKYFKRPQFEAVDVPLKDPIFTTHEIPEIPQRIQFPILTRKCLQSPKWADNPDETDKFLSMNQDATSLHLSCNLEAESIGMLGWGRPPAGWHYDVGSVLVIRQDKKPLHPLHVEALCRYTRHQIKPLLNHSAGVYEPDEPLTKQQVSAMICRPSFNLCWYKLLDEKNAEGGRYRSVPFPHSL